MKSTIIAASVAFLATAVAADSSISSCWMTLGQYSPGGTYCAAPLPDFSDANGCQASVAQCQQEYSDCKTTTQSTSACLVLMSRCQILSSCCSNQCQPDSSGVISQDCNLATCNAWNGVLSSTSATPLAATPVVQQKSTPVAATPTAAALVTPDIPCGQCYTDNVYRGLTHNMQPPSGQKMTIQLCMSMCQGAGYRYTGVEYGSECWCGNDLKNGIQPTTGCSNHCAGDTSQVCGGNLMMNIYQKGCAAPVSQASSTAAAYGYNTPAKSTVAAYNAPAKTTTPVYQASKTVAAQTNTPTVGICSIPSAYATPVGGYHAPIVACNDRSDYTSSPWKLYNSHNTASCPVYGQSSTSKACTDACTTQYNSCTKNYAASFNTYNSYSGYKVRRSVPSQNEKRTWWLYGTPATNTYASKDTYSSAMTKCSQQKAACVAANQNTVVKGSCSSGGKFTPSSSSGSSYNTGYASYGSTYGSSSSGSYGSSSNSYGGSAYDNDDYWKQ